MSIGQLFSNNAKCKLGAALAAADTALVFETGKGALFASPGANQFQLLTIKESGVGVEIVSMTARTGDDATTIVRAQESTTALDFSINADVYCDLTAGVIQNFNDTALLDLDFSGDARGTDAVDIQKNRNDNAQVASGSGSVVLGNYCTASGGVSVALGNTSKAAGQGSVAIGAGALVSSNKSVAFNSTYADRLNANSQHISAHKVVAESCSYPDWNFGSDHKAYCALATSFLTEPLDLTGGATWSSSTSLNHGAYVKPTTPNGFMYQWYDNAYPFDDSAYTPSNSGTVEPTWPTSNYAYIQDDAANGYYVAVDTANYAISFDDKVKIETIDIICYQQTGVTVDAVINIGTASAPTSIANGVTVTLSGADDVFSVPINKKVVSDLKIAITSLATGTEQLVRFDIGAKYVKHWL